MMGKTGFDVNRLAERGGQTVASNHGARLVWVNGAFVLRLCGQVGRAYLVLFTGILGLAFTVADGRASAESQAANAHGKDEIAIERLHAAIDAAWNEGNARTFAGYWTGNGILISPMGQASRGRAQIAKDIATELVYLTGSTHKLTIAGISWPAPDVAVVDGEATISNAKDRSGAPLPPLTANFTSVCVKQKGTWFISYLVSYSFLKK
jgi:uncharacterized protein (TIGR02246 family)